MSSSMFYTGLSGLGVARAALDTTAHNTANVYTEGYSRQTVQVSTGAALPRGSGFLGSGAKLDTVSRVYDKYLTNQLSTAQSSQEALGAYLSQVQRIDNLLADQQSGLAPQMQAFFAGVQGVAVTPADPAARQQLVSAGQALAGTFRSVDQYLGDLNSSINDQIAGSAEQVNTYATQIASLNRQISQLAAQAGGQPPNDLLDQRDRLVASLGKIIGTKVVVQDGGQYNVFIGNGQTLVLGDRAATLQAVPSAADPGRQALALRSANGQMLELRDEVLSGGSLGGLLAFRTETLATTQNAVGRLAMALAQSVNNQHQLGVDLNGQPGQAFFSLASPAVLTNARNQGNLALTASVTDTNRLTTSDYALEVGGVPGALTYTLTRLSDHQVIAGNKSAADFPLQLDGLRLDGPQLAGSGTAQPGDTFLIQPTRAGARDLAVQVTDPARVAAASPVVADATYGNRGTGTISAPQVDAQYLATPPALPITLKYVAASGTLEGFPAGTDVTVTAAGTSTTYPAGTPVPYTPNADIGFNGLRLHIQGAPADGDTFTLAKNTGGVSDGSNALLLAGLQRRNTLDGGTSTLSGGYAQLVGTVGNRAMQIQVAHTAQTSLTGQIRGARESMSGVNQDEETANLLMYQQMYQANAKVIQTASAMFDAILGIRS